MGVWCYMSWNQEFFVTTVEKCDKKTTLLPIICERIRPGSTIFSDCWKAYSTLNTLEYEHKTLNTLEYEHKTVNHKYTFVDPTTYAHTQNIENLWWQIKRNLPSTHSCHDPLYLHLSEYIWQNCKNSSSDLFVKFLKDAGKYVSLKHIFFEQIVFLYFNYSLKIYKISVIVDVLNH